MTVVFIFQDELEVRYGVVAGAGSGTGAGVGVGVGAGDGSGVGNSTLMVVGVDEAFDML
ncbi:MAG TPA: hypothetical protein VJB99_01460 [Patescibacteria group bacterium]|nr:hypothetical protein [Patescibacteria group bacterium]